MLFLEQQKGGPFHSFSASECVFSSRPSSSAHFIHSFFVPPKMSSQQKNCQAAASFTQKLTASLLVLALICSSFPNCHAAIFSMADLQQQDSLFGPHNPKMLIGWEEFLKQRPMYGQELILVDKIVPNQIPAKFTPAKGPSKRGDEKRRDFEHGWEQCEFSPISCMLKRRRR